MGTHVCPWYMGYLLANPMRRLFQNPENILTPYITSGMKILEIGPGMGYFSIPMAKLVGESGRIYCVDLQEKMLKSLRRRASKEQLLDRIETRLCSETSLQIEPLAGTVDFALAFAVVHEVPDQHQLFTDIVQSLKKGGLLLISEPKGHVTEENFESTLMIAQSKGMERRNTPNIKRSHSAVLKKN
jgi:ubiquinone/menaquinone biosynthesis C-methylase UbiE